jgi:tryptophan-rich sensory protein
MTSFPYTSMPAMRIALITVPAILAMGFLAGQLSNSGYGNEWFDALAKPDAIPPGWAFGAAWSILYALLGFVLAVLLAAPRSTSRSMALALTLLQLGLNFCWSLIFFGAQQVELGLATITAILLLSLAATRYIVQVSRWSAWLMAPYLGWLSFAAYLNFEIWRLNPGA